MGMIFGIAWIMSSAQAFELTVLGGATYNSFDSSNPSYSGDMALTYGADFSVGFFPGFSLQSGIYSVGKKNDISSNGVSYTSSTRAWEIPAVVKVTFIPFFDFYGGLYLQKYGSSNTISNSSNTGLVANGSSDWTGAGYRSTDLGLKLGTRLKYETAPLCHAVLDINYNRGFLNMGPTGVSSKNHDLSVLVGFSFGI